MRYLFLFALMLLHSCSHEIKPNERYHTVIHHFGPPDSEQYFFLDPETEVQDYHYNLVKHQDMFGRRILEAFWSDEKLFVWAVLGKEDDVWRVVDYTYVDEKEMEEQ